MPGPLFGVLKVVRNPATVEVVPGAVDDLKRGVVGPGRKPPDSTYHAALHFIRRSKAQPLFPLHVTPHFAVAAQNAGRDCLGAGALEVFNQ
jgi:hypothetical protein